MKKSILIFAVLAFSLGMFAGAPDCFGEVVSDVAAAEEQTKELASSVSYTHSEPTRPY